MSRKSLYKSNRKNEALYHRLNHVKFFYVFWVSLTNSAFARIIFIALY